LRWGGDLQGGEPFVFRDPRNPQWLRGFEVEIVESVARRLGVRAEFVQVDWATLLSSLARGDFDVAVNGLEVTPERARDFLLTRPYAAFEESLVVRRERPNHAIGDLTELAGRRVGTLANSLAHALLEETEGVQVVLYDGVEEPFVDLENGRIEAVFLDHVIAARYGLKRSHLVEAARFPGGTYAMALRPADRALWQAVDRVLADMTADGELARILNAWDLLLPVRAETAAPAAARSRTVAEFSAQAALFVRGAGVTLVLSVLAMLVAVTLGLLLSAGAEYGNRSARAFTRAYVELFRGTPVLLQLYVLYYGLAPYLALDAFTTAVLGLGMNYAAYESELYRAGFRAVAVGQREAGLALGMSRWIVFRRVVWPQALKVALPGMANDFIALLKDSSIVSVITVVELTKQMTITAVDLRSWLLPGVLCAALYLAMSLPLARLARRLERRLAGER
jgi:polar amino acid transport system substrate-binding protein